MKNGVGKTILVTGGAGFIGSHVCARLVREGCTVISLDNYFTGSKANHVAGVDYREGHTKDIAKLIPEDPTCIYHLGEYSRVAKSLEEPSVAWDFNIAGTFAVLEFWRVKKCKLVYAGSSTKFAGEQQNGAEGRDLSPYTWMKAVNTELVHNYARWYDLPYAIAYFYNVYGPGERAGVQNYGTVVETFRQCFLQHIPFPVRAPGTQTRAFTHVEDTVDALLLIGDKGQGDEYCICADDVHSLLDIAHQFGGEIELLPGTKTSRSTRAMDASKVHALGWNPQHTLTQYIEHSKKKRV